MRKAFFQNIQCFKGETMRLCCPATKNSSRLFSLILFQRIPILKITVLVPGRMVLSCLRSLQAHKQWNLLLRSQPIGRISKLAHATPMRNLCETHEKPLRGHDEPPGGSKIITRCKGKHLETRTNDWRPTAPILNPKLFVQNHLQRTTLGPR